MEGSYGESTHEVPAVVWIYPSWFYDNDTGVQNENSVPISIYLLPWVVMNVDP